MNTGFLVQSVRFSMRLMMLLVGTRGFLGGNATAGFGAAAGTSSSSSEEDVSMLVYLRRFLILLLTFSPSSIWLEVLSMSSSSESSELSESEDETRWRGLSGEFSSRGGFVRVSSPTVASMIVRVMEGQEMEWLG